MSHIVDGKLSTNYIAHVNHKFPEQFRIHSHFCVGFVLFLRGVPEKCNRVDQG